MTEDVTFALLHSSIQILFAWEDYHLWEFSNREIRIGDMELLEDDVHPVELLKLNEVFTKRRQKMNYLYDFGDNWLHEIVLEKILEAGHETKYPLLLDGERSGPPEDSGGIPGFSYMLEVLKDPKHPERKEYLSWLAGEDPLEEHVDINGINKELRRLKRNIQNK